MTVRGHEVEIWQPQPKFFNLPVPSSLKKWLGYIDQYIVFPIILKKRLKKQSDNVLYVFTDHALGPWVPHFSKLNHVIHCHDFLAQRSAMGNIPQNRTGFGGRVYQKYIRSGYTQGNNFISISKKTQEDLTYFLGNKKPKLSKVVYNGLNQNYSPQDVGVCRDIIGKAIEKDVANGYLLHVGGNQWYKNRVGLIKIYTAYRKAKGNLNIPLILVGPKPNQNLVAARENSSYKDDIYFLCNVPDELVKKAYCGATVFLFPSLAEGFGWPIAEAMASGSAVVTTNEAPMTEVAGNAAVLIDVCPTDENKQDAWAQKAASEIMGLINNAEQKALLIQKGFENAKRFDSEKTLDTIEILYMQILGSN
jgi:glycosyltransferase involved in cell wall biosynthesis